MNDLQPIRGSTSRKMICRVAFPPADSIRLTAREVFRVFRFIEVRRQEPASREARNQTKGKRFGRKPGGEKIMIVSTARFGIVIPFFVAALGAVVADSAQAGCNSCASGAVHGVTVLSPAVSTTACYAPSYRTVCKTIYEPREITAYRLENETVYEQQTVTVHKPVWVEEVRERRYTVARPVYETSEREERVTVMRPVWETQMRDESYDRVRNVFETAEREETVVVRRPVWEEHEREERYMVQRTVEETIQEQVQRTCLQPVTVMRTQVVDQGCYETQTVVQQSPARHSLQWMPSGSAVDPATGLVRYQRPGFVWAPQAGPAQVQQVQVWRPNLVQQQIPVTTMQPVTITETVPRTVCRVVNEEHVRKVPVRVCRMVEETQVRRVPYTVCRQVTERVERLVPVRVCKMVAEEQVRKVPVTTCRIVHEERVEQTPVRVCKMVAEERTVQVPRTVTRRVPVNYTQYVPRTVVMRVPVDPCTGAAIMPAESTTVVPSSPRSPASPLPPPVLKPEATDAGELLDSEGDDPTDDLNRPALDRDEFVPEPEPASNASFRDAV